MSGHSKWATIKHKKAKEDNKRGKIFTKVVREITMAAKDGGGDPAGNPTLRMALEKAKECNMPQENITRAIKKGTGELAGGAAYEAFTYEGYGPHGIALMIDTLSDNKNRTVSELRHAFTKAGGNLAESGAVAWMFESKGVVRAHGSMTDDELLEKFMDVNLDDAQSQDGMVTLTCKPQELAAVKKAAENNGLKVEDAQFEWIAKTTITIEDKEHEAAVYRLLEAVDDLDDVQNVFANLGD